MRRVGTLVSVTTALLLAMATSGFAQGGMQGGGMPAAPAAGGSLASDIQTDWANQKDLIIKAANAMPAEKFDSKPTPAQQTYAERLMHIVQVNGGLLRAIGGKTPAPTINMQARQKADVIAALQQSFDYGAAVLKEFNEQQLLERVTPPRFLGPSAARVRIAYFSLVHTEDIYGQMVVYLRMAGVTPPASAAP